MSRIHPECPGPDASDWPVAAGVFLRREPGEEDDEEEDDDGDEDEDEDDDDDDNEGDGYSE
jgi:hypothetical protein